MNFQNITKSILGLLFYLCVYSQGSAQNVIQLMPPSATADLRFGGDGMAIHKDKMLIGLGGENKAYCYDLSGSLPSVAQVFTMPQNLPYPSNFPQEKGHSYFQDFGKSVALSGDMLAINYEANFVNLYAKEDSYFEYKFWREHSDGAQLFTYDSLTQTWVHSKNFPDLADQIRFSGDKIFLSGHARHDLEMRNLNKEFGSISGACSRTHNFLDSIKVEVIRRNGQTYHTVMSEEYKYMGYLTEDFYGQVHTAISGSGQNFVSFINVVDYWVPDMNFKFWNRFYEEQGGSLSIIDSILPNPRVLYDSVTKVHAINEDYAVSSKSKYWGPGSMGITGAGYGAILKLDRNQGKWDFYQSLDIKLAKGAQVVMDENRFYIGDSTGGGKVYVYQKHGNQWKRIQTLQNPSGQSDENFGATLALHEGTLLVGAPGNSLAASHAGSVYIYKVETPLPAGLNSIEIGNPGGMKSYISHEAIGGKFALSASGDNITGVRDGFNYLYKGSSGNTEIVVRLDQIDPSNPFNLSGIMIREGLSDNASNVFIGIDGHNRTMFQYRNGSGSSTNSSPGGLVPGPQWLKLTRTQNTFQGFVSQDGQNWSPVGSITLPMNSQAYVGVANASASSSNMIHVNMSQLSIDGTSY